MPESVSDSVVNSVYYAFTGSSFLNLATLPGNEAQQISFIHRTVKQQLDASGWLFCVNNWWWQGACVQASENRAMYLAPHLPWNWTILSCTHFTKMHTFNVMYYKSSNGNTYYWRVDNYVAATVIIDYLGTSLPWWMYKTPGNQEYVGTKPGR